MCLQYSDGLDLSKGLLEFYQHELINYLHDRSDSEHQKELNKIIERNKKISCPICKGENSALNKNCHTCGVDLTYSLAANLYRH